MDAVPEWSGQISQLEQPAAEISGVASWKENRAASWWDRQPGPQPVGRGDAQRLIPGASAAIWVAATSPARPSGCAASGASDACRRSCAGWSRQTRADEPAADRRRPSQPAGGQP